MKELLATELAAAENPLLRESVRQSSYGQILLSERPALTSDPGFEIWQVKLESLLTRIDAEFAEDSMPETLSVLKTGLIAAVERDRNDAPDDEAV